MRYIKKYEITIEEFIIEQYEKFLEHLIEILIKSGCTTDKYYAKLSNNANKNFEKSKMIYYEELPLFDIALKKIGNQFYIKIDNRFSNKNDHVIVKSFIEYLENIEDLYLNSDMIGVNAENFRILDLEKVIKQTNKEDFQSFIKMNTFNL